MRHFASILGVLLLCDWVASVVGFFYALEVYKAFKMEVSGLTLWLAPSFQNLPIWIISLFVVWSSVSLAKPSQFGLISATGVCGLCLGIQSGLVPPLFTFNSVINNLDMSSQPLFSSSHIALWILMPSFVLTLILFAAFIFQWCHRISSSTQTATPTVKPA